MICEICKKNVNASLVKDAICPECLREIDVQAKYKNIVAYCPGCGFHDFSAEAKKRFTKDQMEETKESLLTIVIFIKGHCFFCLSNDHSPYRIKFIAKKPH